MSMPAGKEDREKDGRGEGKQNVETMHRRNEATIESSSQ